jgi:hypothetical protein
VAGVAEQVRGFPIPSYLAADSFGTASVHYFDVKIFPVSQNCGKTSKNSLLLSKIYASLPGGRAAIIVYSNTNFGGTK